MFEILISSFHNNELYVQKIFIWILYCVYIIYFMYTACITNFGMLIIDCNITTYKERKVFPL